MNAKNIGIVILVIGLLMTIYTGFNYITQEDVMDLGGVHMTIDENHSANWSPFVGLGVMAIGAVVFLSGKKKSV